MTSPHRLAIASVLLLAAILPQPALAQQAQPTSPVLPLPSTQWPSGDQALTELGRSLVNCYVSMIVGQQWDQLEQFLAPCDQSVRFNGASDRSANLEAIKKLNLKAPTITEIHGTRVGDVLIVASMMIADEVVAGQRLPTDPRGRLGAFAVIDGSWKLLAWANLNSPSPRPPPGSPAFAGDSVLNSQAGELITRVVTAQFQKDWAAFDAMLSPGLQVVNFNGVHNLDRVRDGSRRAEITAAPSVTDARGTACGDCLIATCNLSLPQKVGVFSSLPADPAPFLAVFIRSGDAWQVAALASTNRPK